jgi:Family of unknown function (DUF5908)
MPIEIMELIVRAVVSATEPDSSSRDHSETGEASTPQASQAAATDLQKTAQAVLDLIKNKKER